MNCKPGDLAVIVSGPIPQNIGLVLRCAKLRVGRWLNPGAPAWLVTDRKMFAISEDGHVVFSDGPVLIYDEHLRPIRDNDGEDETFEWAGKPCQQPA